MPELLGYLLLFTGVGAAFIFVNLMAGKMIRPATMNAEKATIYECGEPTIGSAWIQFDLRFYVVALLFVIFDVEMAFFFPWAVVFGKATALADPSISIKQRIGLDESFGPINTPEALKKSAKVYRNANDPEEIAKLKGEWETRVNDAKGQVEKAKAEEVRRLAEAKKDAKAQTESANAEEARKLAEANLDSIEKQGPDRTTGQLAMDAEAVSAKWLAWAAFIDILFFFGVLLVGFAYLWKRGDLDWVRSTAGQKAIDRGLSLSSRPRDQLVVLTKD